MKKLIIGLIFILAASIALVTRQISGVSLQESKPNPETTQAEISTSGSVVSQNQASLYFQVGGVVTTLPFQVGDSVKKGDVVAALDATDALHQETAAEANYRSAQSALNLVLDNIHLFQYGNGGFGNVGSPNETQTQKTQRQQAEEAVNVAYDNLQIAKQNLSQYSLVAPFDGILTQESITSVGINISSLTSSSTTFTVSDPTKAVFQVLLSPSNSGLIQLGSKAKVVMDNLQGKTLQGSVVKLYPNTQTDALGNPVYRVDILVPNLLSLAKFGSTGSAQIQTTNDQTINSVPTWTVLNNQYLWVMEGEVPILKKVTVGDSRGGMSEITGGLSKDDKPIGDPKTLVRRSYKLI